MTTKTSTGNTIGIANANDCKIMAIVTITPMSSGLAPVLTERLNLARPLTDSGYGAILKTTPQPRSPQPAPSPL